MPFPGIYPVLPPQTFDLQLPGSDCQTALGHGLQSRLYGVPVRFGDRLFLTEINRQNGPELFRMREHRRRLFKHLLQHPTHSLFGLGRGGK